MKIIFVISSRMPTEKAYGVTILNTANAIAMAGTESEIWSVSEVPNFQKPMRPFAFQQEYISKMRELFSSTRTITRYLAYFANLLRVSLHTRTRMNSEEKSLIILREPPLLFLLQLFSFKSRHHFLLEIHHTPNNWIGILLKFWRKLYVYNTATISKSLSAKSGKLLGTMPTLILPMAASQHFRGQIPLASDSKSFVYYGKLTSSGHDNGILEVLRSVKECQTSNTPFHFTLIGFDSREQQTIENQLSTIKGDGLRFSVMPHVDNDKLPKILKTHFASVIPYPNSKYNNERFPIKMVELAALGIPLIVSDIPGFRELLPDDCAIWFSLRHPETLIQAIEALINESELERHERIVRLQRWSEQFSYENRANLLIEFSKSLEVAP